VGGEKKRLRCYLVSFCSGILFVLSQYENHEFLLPIICRLFGETEKVSTVLLSVDNDSV
jgi:hypothetical protein